MKVLVNSILLIVLSIFISCNQEKSDMSGTYQLTELTPITISHENQTVVITASNFNDSRCPANSECVWEGYATADLSIKTMAIAKEIRLCTGGCNMVKLPKEEWITFNGVAYQIQLKDVNASTSQNQKIAFITLTKKQSS